MLGGILPTHWWRRGLSVSCRSQMISAATSVNPQKRIHEHAARQQPV